MINKKILLIPTLTLSAVLLLTACTSGDTNEGKTSSPSVTSTTGANNSEEPTKKAEVAPIPIGDVAPPEEMESKYKGFFFAPTTLDTKKDGSWSYYKGIGAKSYVEDSASRSTTTDEYSALKEDDKSFQKYDKVYGEISSDVEQTALKISKTLKEKPTSTIEELNSDKSLIVNRYGNIGSLKVEQEERTGFYFVLFNHEEGHTVYGIIVPQDGVTPDFSNGYTEEDTIQK